MLKVLALVTPLQKPLLEERIQDSQDRIGMQRLAVHLHRLFRARPLGVLQSPKVWNLLVADTTLDLTVPNRKVGGTNVNHRSMLDMLDHRRL